MKAYRILISDAALLDILDAIEWYENQKVGLGDELESSLNKSILILEENPLLAAKKYKDFRVIYIKRFPYGIHFLIERDIVKVFGFFHVRQNPKRWRSKF